MRLLCHPFVSGIAIQCNSSNDIDNTVCEGCRVFACTRCELREEMRCNRQQATSLVLVLCGRAQAASNQQNKQYNEIVQRARTREHNTCDTFRILELRTFCTNVIIETVSLLGVILTMLPMRHSSLRVHLYLFLSLQQASQLYTVGTTVVPHFLLHQSVSRMSYQHSTLHYDTP